MKIDDEFRVEQRQGRTLTANIYRILRQDIIDGKLPPDFRIRVEEIRQRYNVGVSPLREALIKLASEGLVVLEEHKGFRVAPATREDLLDIINMRKELDTIGLRLSIERGTNAWEASVVAELHKLKKQAKIKDGRTDDEWENHHRSFHSALIGECGSTWLNRFRDILYDQLARYRQLSENYLGEPRDDLPEHIELAEAALERDADRAVTLLRQHIDFTADAVLKSAPEFPR